MVFRYNVYIVSIYAPDRLEGLLSDTEDLIHFSWDIYNKCLNTVHDPLMTVLPVMKGPEAKQFLEEFKIMDKKDDERFEKEKENAKAKEKARGSKNAQRSFKGKKFNWKAHYKRDPLETIMRNIPDY